MRQFESETTHRRQLESTGLNAEVSDGRRKHWMGFAISIAAIAGAVGCAYLGIWEVGAPLAGVPVGATILALFKHRDDKPQ